MVEKEEFLAMLRKVVSGIDFGERLLICGNLNGHVESEIDSLEGVHCRFGFGKRNVEGEMILEFADALNLIVLNTWFKKERRLFTYEYAGLWLITSMAEEYGLKAHSYADVLQIYSHVIPSDAQSANFFLHRGD